MVHPLDPVIASAVRLSLHNEEHTLAGSPVCMFLMGTVFARPMPHQWGTTCRAKPNCDIDLQTLASTPTACARGGLTIATPSKSHTTHKLNMRLLSGGRLQTLRW